MKFFFYLQTNFSLNFFSNMTTCPDQRTVNFTIFPEGLEERVEIEVEHMCDCDCQLEPEAVINNSLLSCQQTLDNVFYTLARNLYFQSSLNVAIFLKDYFPFISKYV